MHRQPVRGTQSIVGQMGWVLGRPSLTALEVAWRWLVGAPILFVFWIQLQKILAELPPESTGLNTLDLTNPWVSSLKVAVAWDLYRPSVVTVLRWLVPVVAGAWIVVSGIGRNIVLKRMEPRLAFRPIAMIALQAAWVTVLAITGWAWWASIGWAAKNHIGTGAEPDLVGYTMWAIFLTLGFFTLWALISWVVAIAPMVLLLEDCSTIAALARSISLGKAFTSKLVEVNLVMGIVKLALLVLAMVFSSVLIPFADQIGAGTLYIEWFVVSVFYFVASDYFHVVRLKGFIEFWRIFRGDASVGDARPE
jgi:hypothetical protein